MNTKRSTILLVLLAVVVLPLFTGCFGVGENDPFLSLRSRKARVTGDWNVSSYIKDVKITHGEPSTGLVEKVKTVATGTSWKQTTVIGDNDSILTGKVLQHKFNFDKEGNFDYTYEYVIITEVTNEETFETTTTRNTIKETINGTWNFLAGIDQYKNKERLALVIMSNRTEKTNSVTVQGEDDEEPAVPVITYDVYNYEYENGELSVIWTLEMLKNSDMHITQDIDNISQTNSSTVQESQSEVGYQRKELTKAE